MIWLHLSNIVQLVQLTGIPRTEYEIFTFFSEKKEISNIIKFCTYDPKQGFVELTQDQIFEIKNYYQSKVIENSNTNKLISTTPKGTFSIVKRLCSSISKRLHTLQIFLNRIKYPFKKNDIYISTGLNIKSKAFRELKIIKQQVSLNINIFCYDIIPLTHPSLVKEENQTLFYNYMLSSAQVADRFFCNSYYVKKQLVNFLRIQDLHVPSIEVVPLGCQLINKIQSKNFISQWKDLIEQPFMLYVSTIEIRKNHQILYQAYLELMKRNIPNLPKLIFIGRKGWMVDSFLSQLDNDIGIKNKILAIENVSDSELIYFYKNSIFTLFPSFVEGYGLPVAESLAFGKYCLAANTSSLPEVGKNFIDYVDPNDAKAWADKIEYLLTNPEYLVSKENFIKSNYNPILWADAAQNIFSKISY